VPATISIREDVLLRSVVERRNGSVEAPSPVGGIMLASNVRQAGSRRRSRWHSQLLVLIALLVPVLSSCGSKPAPPEAPAPVVSLGTATV
jgi:hypothetical protein